MAEHDAPVTHAEVAILAHRVDALERASNRTEPSLQELVVITKGMAFEIKQMRQDFSRITDRFEEIEDRLRAIELSNSQHWMVKPMFQAAVIGLFGAVAMYVLKHVGIA